MSERVCLRCDWGGAIETAACPRCGATLYASAAEVIPPASTRPTLRPDPPRPDPEPEAPGPPERQHLDAAPQRTRPPIRVLAGLGALVLVLALVWSRLPLHPASGSFHRRPASSSAAGRSDLLPVSSGQGTGSLVYVVDVGKGRQIVWKLDLASGLATRGPKIPFADELVDASATGPGWLGFTSPTRSGRAAAYLLHGTWSPTITPVRVARGERIVWGPEGGSLATSVRLPPRASCRSRTRLTVFDVPDDVHDRLLDVCSPVTALGQTGTATYFSDRGSDGTTRLSFIGVGVAHQVARGYQLISASPASDLLVTPTSGGLDTRGTALYWQGTGAPVRLGSNHANLFVRRVLAWSSDGSRVALVGRFQERSGIYLIDAGPGAGPRPPTFVIGGGRQVSAAFSDSGVLYLSINGHVMARADGRLSDVLLPPSAPTPTGPIAWIA